MARSSGVKYPIPWILRKGVFDPIYFHLHPESLGVDGFSVKGFVNSWRPDIFMLYSSVSTVRLVFPGRVFRRSFLFHLRCAPVFKLHHPVTCLVAI